MESSGLVDQLAVTGSGQSRGGGGGAGRGGGCDAKGPGAFLQESERDAGVHVGQRLEDGPRLEATDEEGREEDAGGEGGGVEPGGDVDCGRGTAGEGEGVTRVVDALAVVDGRKTVHRHGNANVSI